MRCLTCHAENLDPETEVCPNCNVYLKHVYRHVLKPKTLIGTDYMIEEALGRGGFGITYKAKNIRVNKTVAIKEYFPDHVARDQGTLQVKTTVASQDAYERGLQRFVKEAKGLASLNHPHIVRVDNLLENLNGTSYIVMEYLDGHSLRREMTQSTQTKDGQVREDQQPLPETRVREIMRPLVGALASIHRVGMMHLDIKPDNVVIENSGRVVLIDFGASRRMSGQGHSTSSNSSAEMSVDYAPPELRALIDTNKSSHWAALGPQSDIFEMGMMLHEMLTGQRPPRSEQRLFLRLHGTDWEPTTKEAPWYEMITAAIRMETTTRPTDIQDWWKSSARRGADKHCQVFVTPEQLASGNVVVEVSPGAGIQFVKLPPDASNGKVFPVKGYGLPGVDGGENGDLRVTIIVKEPDLETKFEKDLADKRKREEQEQRALVEQRERELADKRELAKQREREEQEQLGIARQREAQRRLAEQRSIDEQVTTSQETAPPENVAQGPKEPDPPKKKPSFLVPIALIAIISAASKVLITDLNSTSGGAKLGSSSTNLANTASSSNSTSVSNVTETICTVTKLKATKYCPRVTTSFASNQAPRETCTVHTAKTQMAANAKLLSAARNSNLEAVKQAVQDGADINAQVPKTPSRSYMTTALVTSLEVDKGDDVLVWLLEQGADVNGRTSKGETALMFAAHNDNLRGVELLLQKGADPDLSFKNGVLLQKAIDFTKDNDIKALLRR